MNDFINLHLNVIRYLHQELKKKKTFKEIIELFKTTFIAYLKGLLQMYKVLFLMLDPEYRKQRKIAEKTKQYRKDIVNAYRLLKFMIEKGKTKLAREQIRADFIKHGMLSKDLEKQIMSEVYVVKGD